MRIGILRTLCVMLLCVCFGMPTISLSYGESTMSGRPPLTREFGSKPGAYDLAIRVSQPIVDPGSRLRVEVYISGYGKIQAAKIVFYPSSEVFDCDVSTWVHGSSLPGQHFYWGPEERKAKLQPNGGCATFGCGGKDPNCPERDTSSSFFDARPSDLISYQISTEVKYERGTSPLYLDLMVDDNATPGPHSIQFVLTYFDGQTWRTASKNADFTIRNFYQRHEGPIWWIGGVAAGLTILASVVTLWPVVRQHWPISLVLAALGGVAGGGGKAISSRKKRLRAR